jgi:hypothetical protein
VKKKTIDSKTKGGANTDSAFLLCIDNIKAVDIHDSTLNEACEKEVSLV